MKRFIALCLFALVYTSAFCQEATISAASIAEKPTEHNGKIYKVWNTTSRNYDLFFIYKGKARYIPNPEIHNTLFNGAPPQGEMLMADINAMRIQQIDSNTFVIGGFSGLKCSVYYYENGYRYFICNPKILERTRFRVFDLNTMSQEERSKYLNLINNSTLSQTDYALD